MVSSPDARNWQWRSDQGNLFNFIAEAFASIRYPILPESRIINGKAYGVAPFVQSEVEHIRKHGLYTPRDFDVSPFFAIIKPMLDNGFDYHQLIWNPPDIPPDTPAPKEN